MFIVYESRSLWNFVPVAQERYPKSYTHSFQEEGDATLGETHREAPGLVRRQVEERGTCGQEPLL